MSADVRGLIVSTESHFGHLFQLYADQVDLKSLDLDEQAAASTGFSCGFCYITLMLESLRDHHPDQMKTVIDELIAEGAALRTQMTRTLYPGAPREH